jgi:hypothetical protein
MMRKLIALVLAVTLLVVFSFALGCKKKEEAPPAPAAEQKAPEAAPAPAPAAGGEQKAPEAAPAPAPAPEKK